MNLSFRSVALCLRPSCWKDRSNTIKFTPEGGRIRLIAESRDTRVVFRVEDSGVGIPPELKAKRESRHAI